MSLLPSYPAALGTTSPRSHPYAPSLSLSASSSTSSVFSDAPSQASTASSQCSQWDSQEWSSCARPGASGNVVDPAALAPITRASTFPTTTYNKTCQGTYLPPLQTDLPVPAEQRQHPRRSATLCQRPPPQLVRQEERKLAFVDCLVDSATQMVEVIWPLSAQSSRCEQASGRSVISLRTFIQETLRRSRTSYSTLQVALYYLILIKDHVPKRDFTMEQAQDNSYYRALQCGRRMFLAALILASKYLQDRNFSARAWSKLSSLKLEEINNNEMAFLQAVNWKLHITDAVWERWTEVVLRRASQDLPPSPGASLPNSWVVLLPHLHPGLESVKIASSAPLTPVRPQLVVQETQYPLHSPLPLPGGYSSQESTPTPSTYQAPRFLEPQPELMPPTPSLHLRNLPTPCLTPQSAVSTTPAACGSAFGSRRPSMCSAMAQAQSSSLARSCVDQFKPVGKNGLEAYHMGGRRPSYTSTTSSPESMITDNSRSSRASSISSVSSAGWAPNQVNLARMATCRGARLPSSALSKCKELPEYSSSPDFESFHIGDTSPIRMQAQSATGGRPYIDLTRPPLVHAQTAVEIIDLTRPPLVHAQTAVEIPRPGRKRKISSASLQDNVSNLLSRSISDPHLSGEHMVLPDRSVAQSFLLADQTVNDENSNPNGAKGLQSLKHTVSERQLPVQKDLGRKRTCCGSEAAQQFRIVGPGMWSGLL